MSIELPLHLRHLGDSIAGLEARAQNLVVQGQEKLFETIRELARYEAFLEVEKRDLSAGRICLGAEVEQLKLTHLAKEQTLSESIANSIDRKIQALYLAVIERSQSLQPILLKPGIDLMHHYARGFNHSFASIKKHIEEDTRKVVQNFVSDEQKQAEEEPQNVAPMEGQLVLAQQMAHVMAVRENPGFSLVAQRSQEAIQNLEREIVPIRQNIGRLEQNKISLIQVHAKTLDKYKLIAISIQRMQAKIQPWIDDFKKQLNKESSCPYRRMELQDLHKVEKLIKIDEITHLFQEIQEELMVCLQ